jgi:hypothetical protein
VTGGGLLLPHAAAAVSAAMAVRMAPMVVRMNVPSPVFWSRLARGGRTRARMAEPR